MTDSLVDKMMLSWSIQGRNVMVTMTSAKNTDYIVEQRLIPAVFLAVGVLLAKRGLYLGIEEDYPKNPQLRYSKTPAKKGNFRRIFDTSITLIHKPGVISVETETGVLFTIPATGVDIDRIDELAQQIVAGLPGIEPEQSSSHTKRVSQRRNRAADHEV